jgi:hypothetical protein
MDMTSSTTVTRPPEEVDRSVEWDAEIIEEVPGTSSPGSRSRACEALTARRSPRCRRGHRA